MQIDINQEDALELHPNRSINEEREFPIVGPSIELLQDCFSSTDGALDKYNNDQNDPSLLKAANVVLLNAIDAYLMGRCIKVDPNVLAAAEYSDIKNAGMGLSLVGELEFEIEAVDGTNEHILYFTPSDQLLERNANLKSRLLDDSRILDVHKSSDYPEVNNFVNSIYDCVTSAPIGQIAHIA